MSNANSYPIRFYKRRGLLKTAVGLSGLPLIQSQGFAKEPNEMPPQEGDRLVFLMGDRKGQVIKPEDLQINGAQEMAFPMDPNSKVVRSEARLNQVLLVRLDEKDMTEDTKANSAGGVVAYSAICTHQGCDVSQWKSDTKVLLCVCHGSEYDPKDRASVTFGPAPKRLPALPLKIEGGELIVAGGWKGKPGFKDM